MSVTDVLVSGLLQTLHNSCQMQLGDGKRTLLMISGLLKQDIGVHSLYLNFLYDWFYYCKFTKVLSIQVILFHMSFC